MSEQVRVEDIHVFALFRAALVKFAHASSDALASAESEIARTKSWLESEQATYWQSQLRKRMEEATKARDALRQKKLYKDSSGRVPSAVDEEKALSRALAAVEHAKEKIEAVKKWRPRLEKESGLCRGGLVRLNQLLADDVPKGIALLDRLAMSLEQYVELENAAAAGEAAAPPSEGVESMARSPEQAAPPSVARSPDAAPAAEKSSADAPPEQKKEAPDVPH